ncbi:hypothetical protein ABIA39_003345 [Nocardia sp. GAS34]|uniref:hypothetical protein n=1 Tax=unclassified Nocardia TaxID=2637762 RepID=UPI003D247AEA
MTDQPLLSFQPSTSPSPLQAGTGDAPAQARITIAVSPLSTPVYCSQIQIAVPSEPTDGSPYFVSKPTCSVTPAGKWSVPFSAAVEELEAAGAGPKPPYQFTLTNNASDDDDDTDLLDYPMSIVLTGSLGTDIGTLTCTMGEKSTVDNDKNHKLKTSTVPIKVEAQQFYLRNFMTHSPSKNTVPQTRFAAGDSVEFAWESNGTSFTLYDGDGSVLYQGTNTHVTLPEKGIAEHQFALTSDTTFVLVAEYTAAGFEPTYLNALVPVTVTNPTLEALTVTGLLTAGQGEVTGILNVKTDMTVGDGLTVNGTLYAYQSAYINGALFANSGISSNLGAVEIRGGLTVDGQGVVRLNDPVSIRGGGDASQYLWVSARDDPNQDNHSVFVWHSDGKPYPSTWKIGPDY